jgi:hypothetical protein
MVVSSPVRSRSVRDYGSSLGGPFAGERWTVMSPNELWARTSTASSPAFMIPFQAVLTPPFLELHFFHSLNNLLGLVLVYGTFNLPFGVFVMRDTFSQIPRDLVGLTTS